MKELIKFEWYKFCRRKVMFLSFFIVPILIRISYKCLLQINETLYEIKNNSPKFASNISFPYLAIEKKSIFIISILVVFYVALIITEELRSGESRMTLIKGYDLWEIVLSKIIMISIIVFIIFIQCFILSEIVGNICFPRANFAYTLINYKKIYGISAVIYKLKFYVLNYLTIIAILAFMSFIAVLSKSKLATIGIGVGTLLFSYMYSDLINLLFRKGILKLTFLKYILITQIQINGIFPALAKVDDISRTVFCIVFIYILGFSFFTLFYTAKKDYID